MSNSSSNTNFVVHLWDRPSHLSLWAYIIWPFHLNFLIFLSFVACLKFKVNWQQGYAPTNSDRREGVLRRKRLEYLDCVSQYYDIPDSDRSDDEINMLRQVFSVVIELWLSSLLLSYALFLTNCRYYSCQIAVDCPRTVPDVSFFQELQVQKSLERILYTWLDFIFSCHLPVASTCHVIRAF